MAPYKNIRGGLFIFDGIKKICLRTDIEVDRLISIFDFGKYQT